MIWNYFRRRHEEAERQAKQLEEQSRVLEEIKQGMAGVHGQIQALAQQQKELEKTASKSARLQYKWAQQQDSHWQNVQQRLQKLEQVAEDQSLVENRLEAALTGYMSLFDDIHTALSRGGDSNGPWQQLLQQWAGTIRSQLQAFHVAPIIPLGETFNPERAEAADTVTVQEAAAVWNGSHAVPRAPHTVVQVLRPGYAQSDGTVRRKALVLTIKEEHHDREAQ